MSIERAQEILGGYDVIRVDNDYCGNPLYVVHFLAFQADSFEHALQLSRKSIGGKKYRGKDFGGGIVFQSYNIERDARAIVAARPKKEGE